MQSEINRLGSLAVQNLNAGQPKEAKLHILKILEINPNEINALKLYSHILLGEGNLREAIEVLVRICSINPSDSETIFNLGKAYFDICEYENALTNLQKHISLSGETAEILVDIGITFGYLNRHKEALESFKKALDLQNNFLPALNNIAISLIELKDFQGALKAVDRALKISPRNILALTNKGVILNNLQKYDEALEVLKKAIEVSPGHIEAAVNFANTLVFKRDFSNALSVYRQISEKEPQNINNWINLGSVLSKLGEYTQAQIAFDTASSIKPDYNYLVGQRFQMRSFLCNWDKTYYELKESLSVSQSYNLSEPFHHLYCHDNPAIHQKVAASFSQNLGLTNVSLGRIGVDKKNKLKIAYFSADFRDHPVAYLSAELFELQNKQQFEIFAFSFTNSTSKVSERLKKAFNSFVDVSNMNDIEIASLSRRLGIDIAVDLGGYTQDARPRVFSYRAAPIQIGYLGYLGTMGSSWMDYLIADHQIITRENRSFYSEKIIYIPSYQINDSKRISPTNLPTKSSLGIPQDVFVFCCINHCYKFNPLVFDSWMRILDKAPSSILYLYADNPEAIKNLKHEALLRGIDPKRIIFGDRAPYSDYLARYSQFDLFLDTHPYNAGTTASDSLWSNVPVLTLTGKSFASRYGASLLSSIGLPELITNSFSEYENLAVKLAKNPVEFAKIKSKLSINKTVSRLFNSKEFTKDLESAYMKIFEQALCGKDYEDISIL